MKQLTSHEGLHCANCGARLAGEFCHECGQSFHSVLKPVHHMAEETVETLLHIDGRIVHTLPPLLLKPGFLTLEYFSGRRVRYIAPFRLVFVLCLLALFVCHLRVANSHIELNTDAPATTADNQFQEATTPAAVEDALQRYLTSLKQAREAMGPMGKLAATGLTRAEEVARQQAAQRVQALAVAAGTVPEHAAGTSAAAPANTQQVRTRVNDDWLHSPSQIEVSWLPGFLNDRLSKGVEHLKANLRALNSPGAGHQEAVERMLSNFFSTLPQTMFVMIPLFALLLKLFYAFRRRLYMEHLIVALHSHAFLFLSLLLGVSLGALSSWLAPHAAWVAYPLSWLEWALVLWLPIYLLIMQKKVYRQGWPMTVLKFCCIGYCYVFLLTVALLAAGALGLAR